MTVFVDTNVFVYVHDHGAGEKRQAARRVIEEIAGDLVLSTQVLAEFFWVVTRKLDPPMPAELARAATARLAALPVVPIDHRLTMRAIDTALASRISLWDAQIVEAAVVAGCDRLLTEDLNSGQIVRGVEIVDPFAEGV